MKTMKRFLSLTLVCLLLCGLLPSFAFAADATSGTIAMSNASGNAGETVTVEVEVKSNPGVMALTLEPQFDTTVLELQDTVLATETNWTEGANGKVLFDYYPDSTFTGKVVTYTFKILDNAKSGDTKVELEVSAANFNEDIVAFEVTPATVTVGGGDLNVTFSHSLSLGNNLTIYYMVPTSDLEGYTNVRLHVEKNKYNGDGSSFTVEKYDLTQYEIDAKNRYKFAFSNIAAKEIGDDVLVKVMADTASAVLSVTPRSAASPAPSSSFLAERITFFGALTTVTSQLLTTPPTSAVTVVTPAFFAVSRPLLSTVAIFGLEEVNTAPRAAGA